MHHSFVMDPIYAPHTLTLKNSTFSQQTLVIGFMNSHHFPKQHKHEAVVFFFLYIYILLTMHLSIYIS